MISFYDSRVGLDGRLELMLPSSTCSKTKNSLYVTAAVNEACPRDFPVSNCSAVVKMANLKPGMFSQ